MRICPLLEKADQSKWVVGGDYESMCEHGAAAGAAAPGGQLTGRECVSLIMIQWRGCFTRNAEVELNELVLVTKSSVNLKS